MPAAPYPERGPEHLKLWTERLIKPTFVYVIQGDPGTAIKVGFAKDVAKRMATLQTGNPAKLRLLHVFPADQKLERLLHRKLEQDGAVRFGEWFPPCQTVDDFLCWAAYLADWMVKQHNGSAWAPDYKAFDPALDDTPRPAYTVRWVEPDPRPAEPRKFKRRDGTMKEIKPAPPRISTKPTLSPLDVSATRRGPDPIPYGEMYARKDAREFKEWLDELENELGI